MTEYSIYDAKTKFSEIVRNIENKDIECAVISKNGRPVAKIVPYKTMDINRRLGIAEGLINIPKEFDDFFDDIDISSDFEGNI